MKALRIAVVTCCVTFCEVILLMAGLQGNVTALIAGALLGAVYAWWLSGQEGRRW